jgi:hypothetical protein
VALRHQTRRKRPAQHACATGDENFGHKQSTSLSLHKTANKPHL